MAWSEPHERTYVSPSFLKTAHGKIPCQTCHQGNPRENSWQAAHEGIVRDPTFPDADKACGACHEDITSAAKNSLHYTLAPFTTTIRVRANKNQAIMNRVDWARDRHCSVCHGSCGQCHVSRPDYAQGGFLAGHVFQQSPPMETACAGCHSGRTYKEYTGGNHGYPADVHFARANMTCMDCHTGMEMHADARGIASRFGWITR